MVKSKKPAPVTFSSSIIFIVSVVAILDAAIRKINSPCKDMKRVRERERAKKTAFE